ncbi:MAG: YlxR family protein [Anaerolineae bacterium]|nr:YlxR family protein [Anaerolineae bacterium]
MDWIVENREVTKKAPKRVRHIPQRTCVGCREVLAKRTLVRVVRAPEGVRVDPTGKLAGRGAYLHAQLSCWEKGLKGGLAHALKTELTEQDREHLRAYMAGLSDEPTDNSATSTGLEAESLDQKP